MRFTDHIEAEWNLEIDLFERGKRLRWHQRTHNIVVNTGRQFLAEVITPATLGAAGSFTRYDDSVVRFIGFGIGGSRQSSPFASASPYSDAYPTGYGGTNTQTDSDVTVSTMERPVRVSTGPDLFMQEIAAPASPAPTTETRFVATFAETDISYGSFTSVPLSEIGLYKSTADSSLPNGAAGAYPGAGGHMIAYDTFDTIQKTGVITIEVRWTWRFG